MNNQTIVIIGGGFYGTAIALYLKKVKKISNIILIEKEDSLISRASYFNQARVHNGYHYPRSFTTAYRSHINFQSFCNEWDFCIKKDFDNYYAISRNNSKINSIQYENFCRNVNIPLERSEDHMKNLFNSKLITNIFKVHEYAFDAEKLKNRMIQELRDSKVKVKLRSEVINIKSLETSNIEITTKVKSQNFVKYNASIVLNCTYSGLTQVTDSYKNNLDNLKHEIAEIALIKLPKEINSIGVTVLDGSFFSVLPFPAKNCHSISHVRYTPHYEWLDKKNINPYKFLSDFKKNTRVDRMLRDASRYLPILSKSIYLESFYEIKTVHMHNEIDDGRPLIFKVNKEIKGMFSILGSKLDNIYEILNVIDKIIYKNFNK